MSYVPPGTTIPLVDIQHSNQNGFDNRLLDDDELSINASHDHSNYPSVEPSDDFSPNLDSQTRAINEWTRRVQLCFIAHFLTAICLIRSTFWLSSIVGLGTLLVFYAYAILARLRRKNFVYLYLLVVLLGFVRDGIILFFYLQQLEDGDWFDWLIIVLLFVDAVAVTPLTCYTCFFLHRSAAVSAITV